MLLETNYISYFIPSFNQLCSDWLHVARRRWLGHLCSYRATKKTCKCGVLHRQTALFKTLAVHNRSLLNTTAFMSKLQNRSNLVRKQEACVSRVFFLRLLFSSTRLLRIPWSGRWFTWRATTPSNWWTSSTSRKWPVLGYNTDHRG